MEKAKVVKVVKGYENFNAAAFIAAAGSTSAAIRQLDRAKVSRGDIAVLLNKRYQHVRNVLITPIKKEAAPKQAPATVGTDADITFPGFGEKPAKK
jgi:hypothetical protein